MLYFVYNCNTKSIASALMRTKVLCDIANDERFVTLPSNQIKNIRDSAVILNKNCNDKIATELLKNNNTLYYDPIDAEKMKVSIKYCSGIISSSYTQNLEFNNKYNKKIYHITHPTDKKSDGVDNSHLTIPKICYWGAENNTFGGFLNIDYNYCISTNYLKYKDTKIKKYLSNYNIHFIVRKIRNKNQIKPFTKGFIAAKCNSIVIASKFDPESRYYLGDDYPFFVDSNKKDINSMIKQVLESYNTPIWTKAMNTMMRVKKMSSDNYINAELHKLYDSIAR